MSLVRMRRWVPWSWPAPVKRRGGRPESGELIAWAYAVWRVVELTERARDDGDRDMLYLRRECGPPHPHERHEGIIHVRVDRSYFWEIIKESYPVCSCHGHPWPCRELVEDRAANDAAEDLEVRLARAVPGVCAACGELVTTKQKAVTFPGENLLVPGGPEVTYHLRATCRHYAQEYEERRLAADPTLDRLCTCPGVAFVHRSINHLDEWRRLPVDCSAGPACTGYHYGAPAWCGTSLSTLRHGHVRPTTRCTRPWCQGLP